MRLEFNEKQQVFNLADDDSNIKENTFGWITIFESCTDNEFILFEKYLKKIPEKLTKEIVLENSIKFKEMHNEDLGPEYDSAGFTEEDRVVNGQYKTNQNN